jgi:TctA family transporter
MMDFLSNLALGLSVAVSAQGLLYCFIGCLLGTLVGVLPGLGPAATIAMLLPVTFTLDPSLALIMIAGIFYGAQYGGSTTAILVNLPGEATSVVTTIDGYQMARNGRAGVALATAAIGSFVAGTIATLLIALFAPALAEAALQFGAAEYFALMTLGLITCVGLVRGSFVKGFAMLFAGLLIGVAGTDVNSGLQRFTFDRPELVDGVNFVAVAMGIFGLGEVILNLQQQESRTLIATRLRGLMPSAADFRAMTPPILRGTAMGSLLGIIPGGGAVLASFASYALERRIARDPAQFGKGAIQGVAAPEAANNAAAQTAFIPLLTLGIPANVTMALVAGAMLIQGIQPGPGMIAAQPTLFWGLIVSMWVGNLMLVVLNLPLVGIWARLVSVPYHLLYPAILVFCCIGVFSIANSSFDVLVMAGFGLLGVVLALLDCEPAPLLLGMVIGPLMEENLRRALALADGDPMIFVQRPISAVILAIAMLAVLSLVSPAIRTRLT